MERKKIFVYGASGHAKVVIDIIERQSLFEVVFLIDDDPSLHGKDFYGYPVIGGRRSLQQELPCEIFGGVVAIGSNKARKDVAISLEKDGFRLVSCIHPSAQLARGVMIGDGSVVMAGAMINSDAQIGRNVIINTGASVDHDCLVCDHAHIAPGATLCGTVTVGPGTFICAGATVIPNILIGRNVIVAAGSTVIRSITDFALEAGSPSRYVKTLEEF